LSRTGFVWKDQDEPLQVVLRRVEVPLEQDWRGYQLLEQQEQLKAYFNAARSRGFNLSKPPLMRLALSRWTKTSINSSGPIIISSWMAGAVPWLSRNSFLYQKSEDWIRNYIAWLAGSIPLEFWRKTLVLPNQPHWG